MNRMSSLLPRMESEFSYHEIERQMMSRFLEQQEARNIQSPLDDSINIKESSGTSSSESKAIKPKKSNSDSLSIEPDEEEEEEASEDLKNDEDFHDELASAPYINAYF
jgi:hypothetical protein